MLPNIPEDLYSMTEVKDAHNCRSKATIACSMKEAHLRKLQYC